MIAGIKILKIQLIYFEFWLQMFSVHVRYYYGNHRNILNYLLSLIIILTIITPFIIFDVWFALINLVVIFAISNIANNYSALLSSEFANNFFMFRIVFEKRTQTNRASLSAFEHYYKAVMGEGVLILFAIVIFVIIKNIFPKFIYFQYVSKYSMYILIFLIAKLIFNESLKIYFFRRYFGSQKIKAFRAWEKNREFSEYTIFSSQAFKLFHFWGLFHFTSYLVFKEPFFLFMAIFIYIAALCRYNELSSPPTILFLSSSDDKVSIINKMKRSFTLRLASLVDFSDIKHRSWSDRIFNHSFFLENYRTEKTEEWIKTVSTLMDFVVLIVVDIRNISPAIKKEITLILEKNLLFKTVYLVDNFENNQVVLSRLLDNENYENVNDYIYNENELLVVTKVIMNLNNEANNRPHDFISKDMINFFSSMSYFKLKLHLTMLLYEIKKGLI